MSDNLFFFDDFFVADNDPGLEVKVSSQGREVPICLKKRLTLEDIEAAREKGVDKTIDLKTGAVKVNKIDEGAFTREFTCTRHCLLALQVCRREDGPRD